MQKEFLFLLFYFCSQFVCAQPIKTYRGSIKDSNYAPIEGVIITVTDTSYTSFYFTFSDEKGFFDIFISDSLLKYPLFINFSYLGFIGQIIPFPDFILKTDITLKTKQAELPEVIVKSRNGPRIIALPDTLKYLVRSFSDKSDKVIGDIIKKLPGIEVDENGQIKFNGNPIANLYIDGENLLDGRYKIATDNIPANLIDQVQIIKNEQPIRALKGYASTDRVSLNITLNDSAKLKMINSGEAGIGNNACKGQLNNIILRKKIKSINLYKYNQTGDDISLELKDLSNETTTTYENEYNPLLNSSEVSIDQIGKNRYIFNKDHIGNINTSLKINDQKFLRINAAIIDSKQRLSSESGSTFFSGGEDSIRYSGNDLLQNCSNTLQAALKFENNKERNFFQTGIKLEIPSKFNNAHTTQNQQIFLQELKNSNFTLGNTTTLIKPLTQTKLLQYESKIIFKKIQESLGIEPGVLKEVLNNNEIYKEIDQKVFDKSYFINQAVSYRAITKFGYIACQLQINHQGNFFKSNTTKTTIDGKTDSIGVNFINDIILKKFFYSLQLESFFKMGKSTIAIKLTPGINQVSFNRFPNGKNESRLYKQINPYLNFRTPIGKFSDLHANYNHNLSLGTVRDIYGNNILLNFRQINSNKIPLPISSTDIFTLRIQKNSALKLLFFYTSLSVALKTENFILSSLIDSGLTVTNYLPITNKFNSYSVNMGLSKYFYDFKTTISLNGAFTKNKSQSLINEKLIPYMANQFLIRIKTRSRFLNNFILSTMIEKDITNTRAEENGVFNTGLIRNTTQAELKHIINSRFNYAISFIRHLSLLDKNTFSAVNFLDADFNYRPLKSKIGFNVSCTNLLNQKFYLEYNNTPISLYYFQVPLRARTIIFTIDFAF